MNAQPRLVTAIVAALTIAACNSVGSYGVPGGATGSPVQSRTQLRGAMPEWMAKGLAKPACPQIIGKPTCLVLIQSRSGISRTVAGWGPADFQKAYHLPSATNGAGQIVAIVESYDNPNVAKDLATYRAHFGLGKGKFRKYNQLGQQGNYPGGSSDWGVESDLGVEMVAAACPKCTIYLIEANSPNVSDLGAAVSEAVTLDAHIVNASWVCFGSLTCFDPSTFDAPGVVYVAASGNLGYDQNGSPEALATVVSVGGTVLFKKGSKYSEQVWDGSGGGCSSNGGSTGVTKPAWQKDPGCSWRTDADVSAVAWNVAEYDSYGLSGWFASGGPGAATPLISAVFALAGNASKQDAARKFWITKGQNLNYVSAGEDGLCGGEYLCQAGTKQFGNYSGPAGWGTPNGVKAF